jgi:hypothetical protein
MYELLMLLSTIVTALGGVGFVVVMMQTYKGQMNAQIFNDLNQWYDDIVKAFPEEAWDAALIWIPFCLPPVLRLPYAFCVI